MNIEEFDGFFAALIAGPEVVPPSEYLPEVFGGEMSEACEFSGLNEANDILGLIMRHWNGIAATLHKSDVHLPILLGDDNGVCQGSDWARGFVRGMDMRSTAWAELLADEEQCGWMVPVLMLYHEHDEDPELRSGPIGPEKRRRSLCRCWPASLMPTGTFGYIDNSQRALSRTNLIAVQGKLEGMTCVLAVPGENTSAAVVE